MALPPQDGHPFAPAPEHKHGSVDNVVDIDEVTVVELRLGNIPIEGELFFDNGTVNHVKPRCRVCGNPIDPRHAFCEYYGSKKAVRMATMFSAGEKPQHIKKMKRD